MAARVFSQQLDRTKPLWELWMVQGLTRKRFAFVTKTHHALVDGVSGVDIATVLFDVKPVPEPAEADARLGRRTPSPRPPSCWPRTSRGWPDARSARCGGSSAPSSTRGDRCSRSPRRSRRSARSAGTSPTRRPTVPLNVAGRLAPAVRVGARRPGPVQADQGRARRDGQRRRARRGHRRAARLAAHARRAHRGPRAARAGPGLDPRRATSAASSATRSPRSAGPIPVYVEDPVKRLEICREGWRASSSRSRRSAPR